MMYIIAAMTHTRVIGSKNALPWRIPEEMQNFKKLTTGHTVIMGLNTYHSIGKALPHRNNIVLSHEQLSLTDANVCTSLEDALTAAQKHDKDIYIIGGAYTYAQFLPHADRMYISYIKADYEGDVFFPEFDSAEWIERERVEYETFTRVLYERKG